MEAEAARKMGEDVKTNIKPPKPMHKQIRFWRLIMLICAVVVIVRTEERQQEPLGKYLGRIKFLLLLIVLGWLKNALSL